MTQLPAAMAGATLAQIWFIGQFQGVMSATTPMGSNTTLFLPVDSSSSKFFRASSVAPRWPMPEPACAVCASEMGAPISSLMALAMSPMRAL